MDTVQSIIQQLGLNKTFFTMAAIFIVTYWLINYLALGRLTQTLIEREKRIEGRENETLRLKEEFDGMRSRLSQEMKKARAESNAAFADFKNKAANEQRSILNAARETAAREIQSTRENITEKTQLELKKLEAEIPQIAQMIVTQILKAPSSFGAEKKTEVSTGA